MPRWLDEMTNAGEPVIPANLRNAVWERDEGQCVKCGTKEDVDVHCVVPYAMPTVRTTRPEAPMSPYSGRSGAPSRSSDTFDASNQTFTLQTICTYGPKVLEPSRKARARPTSGGTS